MKFRKYILFLVLILTACQITNSSNIDEMLSNNATASTYIEQETSIQNGFTDIDFSVIEFEKVQVPIMLDLEYTGNERRLPWLIIKSDNGRDEFAKKYYDYYDDYESKLKTIDYKRNQLLIFTITNCFSFKITHVYVLDSIILIFYETENYDDYIKATGEIIDYTYEQIVGVTFTSSINVTIANNNGFYDGEQDIEIFQ